jgi:hypothetical protein
MHAPLDEREVRRRTGRACLHLADQLVSGFSLRVLLTSPHRSVAGATTVPQLAVGLVEVTAKVPRSGCLNCLNQTYGENRLCLYVSHISTEYKR